MVLKDNYFIVFLKGLIMGFCDIIPGISGGTIALITGIYEKFMNSLKNINFFWVVPFLFSFKNKSQKIIAKKEFMRMNPQFLFSIGMGIGIAIIIGSFIIPKLIDNYTSYTYSFFLSLIASSAIVLLIKNKISLYSSLFLFLGFIFGFFVTGLKSIYLLNNPFILFISGFLAISAMLLPGISGSFLLLILGQYKFILEALHNFWNYSIELIFFSFGLITGLLISSRIISSLLKYYYSYTLFFLIGLMLGALRLPITEISFETLSNIDLIISSLIIFFSSLIIFLLYYFESSLKKRVKI
jgi:putative membrane protein